MASFLIILLVLASFAPDIIHAFHTGSLSGEDSGGPVAFTARDIPAPWEFAACYVFVESLYHHFFSVD
ncbi:hypothetical protein QCA50_005110 [Cerrena zonata]|uniref:Uncharacterized protein n=1 Tax=Cerrena zonata TaxID=2478898 RepID=A0AAW0GEK3_9APHY